jgi:hypothetical protein
MHKEDWKTWVQWYEVTGGERGTIEEFRELLKKYNRNLLLVMCAQMSVAFAYGPEAETTASDELTKLWARVFFAHDVVPKIDHFHNNGRLIFFQGQLRFIAAEIIRLAPETTPNLTPLETHEIGQLLLRASELMYFKHQDQKDHFDQLANRISQFLPIYEIDSPTDTLLLLLRFYIFITINIPRLVPERRLFDVDAMFFERFGIELRTFAHLLKGFEHHALMMRWDTQLWRGSADCGMRKANFEKSTVSDDLLNRMFNEVSFSWETLRQATEAIGYADFDYLKDQPYFRWNDALYCLDYEFAMGKLESAAIWRIVRTLKGKKGGEYLGYWGYVFEDYVAWLFETYSVPKFNTVISSPRYADDASQEICDTVLICGSTAVLIESKLATCKSKIRYSGDFKLMKEFLEERLVTGAGVSQLRNAIELLTGSSKSIPCWTKRIRKIMPVIVTRDDIGSCWYVNAYLNDRFEEDLQRKDYPKHSITPLVSMSIGSLERCIKELKRRSFSDVLESRIHANRDMIWTFEKACKYVNRGSARELPEHVDALGRFREEVIKGLGLHD